MGLFIPGGIQKQFYRGMFKPIVTSILTEMNTANLSTFILAGGQGERLHPLTVSRPKPSVSFGGMFRIIDFTLSNCLRSGLSRVSLLTQYKYEELHRYIREGWSELWIRKSENREPLICLPPMTGKRYRGTADAIFQNIGSAHDRCDFVLVLSGDHIYQMDYRELLRQHIETNADVTIAAVEYPIREASHFGVLQVDDTFRITDFVEKPASPRPLPSNPSMALVSMGVYVFNKTILADALDAVCGSGQGFDIGHDIIPALIRSGRAYAYDFRSRTDNMPQYWRDIGTIDSYYTASMEFAIAAGQWDDFINPHYPGPRIDSTAKVEHSVLSPGVQVEQSAKVCDSVLMPGVRVGKGAQLRRVIVEEGSSVPPGFSAGFDAQYDRNRHTVSEKGVVVIGPESTRRRTDDIGQHRWMLELNSRDRQTELQHG